MEMEGKDTVPGTIQSPRHTNADHTEAIRQIGNGTKGRQEHKQMHKQETYTMMTFGWISRKLERFCYY